jgi:hypothetical protein
LFTPVVLAGTLTVPLLAGAHEKQNKHRWPAPPAAAPQATTTATQPSAPAAPVADDRGAVEQETQTTETAPAAAPAVEAAAVDQSGADSPSDAAEDAPAPGFVVASVQHDDHGDDDRGKGKDKGKGKGKDKPKGRGHAYGHAKDKQHGRGHAYGHDKDHGHDDKGDDHSSDDKPAPAAPAAAAPAAASLQPIASPSLAGLAKQVLNPRACTSRRAVSIRLDRGYEVRAARVLLNGHLVRVVRHDKKVSSTIDLRSRARGTYTVRTVVVTKGNKIRIGTRRFTTCAAKKH